MEYLIPEVKEELQDTKRLNKEKKKRDRINKKYIVLGEIEDCPRCLVNGEEVKMQRRKHREKPLKIYFFNEWDYCLKCGHVQHYEKFKSEEWQEEERTKAYFRSM